MCVWGGIYFLLAMPKKKKGEGNPTDLLGIVFFFAYHNLKDIFSILSHSLNNLAVIKLMYMCAFGFAYFCLFVLMKHKYTLSICVVLSK